MFEHRRRTNGWMNGWFAKMIIILFSRYSHWIANRAIYFVRHQHNDRISFQVFKRNQEEAAKTKRKSKIYSFICASIAVKQFDSNRITVQWLHVPVHLSDRRKWPSWSRSYGIWSKNVHIHCYHYYPPLTIVIDIGINNWISPCANEIWCSHPLVVLKYRVEISRFTTSPDRTLKWARDNYYFFFKSNFSFLEWFNCICHVNKSVVTFHIRHSQLFYFIASAKTISTNEKIGKQKLDRESRVCVWPRNECVVDRVV